VELGVNMINLLLSMVTGTFKSWFDNKQETDKLKSIAKIENSKNHLSGYSDEFLILVWSYPFISMFIPATQQSTALAFEKLALLPEWYVGGYISITFAVFGIDKLFRYKGFEKNG